MGWVATNHRNFWCRLAGWRHRRTYSGRVRTGRQAPRGGRAAVGWVGTNHHCIRCAGEVFAGWLAGATAVHTPDGYLLGGRLPGGGGVRLWAGSSPTTTTLGVLVECWRAGWLAPPPYILRTGTYWEAGSRGGGGPAVGWVVSNHHYTWCAGGVLAGWLAGATAVHTPDGYLLGGRLRGGGRLWAGPAPTITASGVGWLAGATAVHTPDGYILGGGCGLGRHQPSVHAVG